MAAPHLASRRARRSADRRLGDPRRRAAQDGHLRLRPLRAAALSRRRCRVEPTDRCSRRGRDRLWRPRRDGAARHEEARRVLLGEPSRIRHARHREPELGRAVRGRLSDGRPWAFDGRPVLARRRGLRAAAHAPHLRVRRSLEADAALRRLLPRGDVGVDRSAGSLRLRRRVLDPHRCVPSLALARRRRRLRRGARRGLHAAHVPARDVRRDRREEERKARRHAPRRDRGARAAARSHRRDGRVPATVPRGDRELGGGDPRARGRPASRGTALGHLRGRLRRRRRARCGPGACGPDDGHGAGENDSAPLRNREAHR